MSEDQSNEQRMHDEIEYLSRMTGEMTSKLQTYEYVFSLIDDIRLKPPATVTCKYRQLHGTSRRRNKGKQCPPNCQVIIGRANTQWGKGCQMVSHLKEKRAKENE
jgi:hypothetical protein